MVLSDLAYSFDPSLVAQRPAAVRDLSRLLLYDRSDGKRIHTRFRSLPGYLKPGDLLVYNDSRVIPARLLARKPTGGKVELLLVRELGPGLWEAIVGGAVREGTGLIFADGREARIEALLGGGRGSVRFSEDAEVGPWIERQGEVPLPPYIRREKGPEPEDRERYQTVFARSSGSVAAPTAGLHFTPDLLEALRARGVEVAGLTLHVGPGTFLPIRSDRLSEHRMHAERYFIPPETVSAIMSGKSRGARIIAVGTTTTRALESVFGEGPALLPEGETELFIRPGYRFNVVTGLITNFHLPRTTLLVLLAAFLGPETVLSLYEEAVRERYRFYSFGDAMCIL
jgi:S-adenosylmethionine:tRNA ribosyltransferase-isomerase